jgi:hypothetical protein
MEQKSTFWKSAMTYGIYLAVAMILFNVILYVLGQSTNKTMGIIAYVILGAGIYICQVQYRNNELGGYIDYSKALGFGVAIMLFTGVLNTVYTLILMKIDPSIMEQIRIMQEEAMMQRGMTDEQIEVAGQMMSKMQNPVVMAVLSLFSFAIFGFIISLVTSIFVKKKEDENAFDEAMGEIKPEE